MRTSEYIQYPSLFFSCICAVQNPTAGGNYIVFFPKPGELNRRGGRSSLMRREGRPQVLPPPRTPFQEIPPALAFGTFFSGVRSSGSAFSPVACNGQPPHTACECLGKLTSASHKAGVFCRAQLGGELLVCRPDVLHKLFRKLAGSRICWSVPVVSVVEFPSDILKSVLSFLYPYGM